MKKLTLVMICILTLAVSNQNIATPFNNKHVDQNKAKPYATVAGMKSGVLTKSLLSTQTEIKVMIENASLNSQIVVTNYFVKIERNGQTVFTSNYSDNKFPQALITEFGKLQANDKVTFFNINAKGSDNTKYSLDPVVLDIKL